MPQLFPMNWILISFFLIFSMFTMNIIIFYLKINFNMKTKILVFMTPSNTFKW
uniref:ATP synthase subunit 8 n=1 Tax=Amblyomma testudinarium TaxID=375577 RepID=A0A7R6VSB9_AMBTS|nr:ATP synthase F0 subunit 8 [Amblyomma testudinarium]UNO54290.1 ATP synthase F0 subunit 8 [Amblyomma testudinarium]BCG44735.1 ATP synthase subunit 8 [Amblyomma testudinarium]BCG67056.1 ATP synthase subunit 8 [Amblyomma testudinarium]BCG67069.1 ATP synthase subunit 8 [Amblyomma testudinarium]BCG67095.1 ATP synthase subunit 8 [Amblyomma testudinarium]